jgi:hypothetical protein
LSKGKGLGLTQLLDFTGVPAIGHAGAGGSASGAFWAFAFGEKPIESDSLPASKKGVRSDDAGRFTE